METTGTWYRYMIPVNEEISGVRTHDTQNCDWGENPNQRNPVIGSKVPKLVCQKIRETVRISKHLPARSITGGVEFECLPAPRSSFGKMTAKLAGIRNPWWD